ncbi:serine hydrolase [Aliifodinibius sp. S!AR15-10]|uniref:serine hydrolase n=1 Tax=Aliifodinibius sp. S!AR15-10 TaxID=2950437 RepID=UPI00285E633E|nr:serine hydrolase [Aliifodinibius sp. S!AR15-10]MDR8389819.1 serine hydrolase [Aliifodinibius sp. S!AR15-10]
MDFTINDVSHLHDAPVQSGELQIWEISNPSMLDHPFHLHGFFFQVLEVNGQAPAFNAWKDTFNIPRDGKVKIAWLPDHRTGKWMYHCHILEHATAGMMAHFEVVDSQLAMDMGGIPIIINEDSEMNASFLKEIFLNLLLVAGLGGHLQAQPTIANFPEIDRYLQGQMVEADIPGAALAIVKGDQIVHLKGYGQTDLSGNVVTPQTPFMLGSTGKSITALAIMQLVEAELIDVNAPATQYLPWFHTWQPEVSGQITFRHLLTHASGISSSFGLAQMSDGDTTGYAIEKQVRNLGKFNLTVPPGSRFQYSNANYIILGMVIQEVTGVSYEEYIQEQIFDPLEMTRCFTSRPKAVKFGLATAHRKWFGQSMPSSGLPFVRGAISAGYQMCSLESMAHYLIAQLNGGRYRDHQVLSVAGMEILHQPAVEAPGRGHYGMGWAVTTLDGTPVVVHGGAAPGYLSDIILVPEQNLGVVLLMNTYTPLFSKQQMEIADNIIRMLLSNNPVESTLDLASISVIMVLIVILLLQIAGVFFTLRRLKRWKSGQSPLPQNLWQQIRYLVLPLALNVGWAVLVFIAIPKISQILWPVILLFQPDVGWLAMLSGSIALLAGLVRTGFVANSFSKRKGLQKVVNTSIR